MRLSDLKDLILKSDPKNDWEGLSMGSHHIWFYKEDVNLRIETTYEGSDIQCEDFKDDWANKFLHPKAIG